MATASSAVIRRSLAFRVLDPVFVVAVTVLTYWLREGFLPATREWGAIAVLAAWTAVALHMTGAYEAITRPRVSRWFQTLLFGLVLALGGMLALAYALKVSHELSRSVVGIGFLASLIGLTGLRLWCYVRVIADYRAGKGVEPAILVGQPHHSLSLSRHLKRHPELGIKPVAIVSDRIEQIDGQTQTTVLNGNLLDLPGLIERHHATRIIICGDLGDQAVIAQCLQLVEGSGVDVHYAPDYSSVPIFIFRANEFAGRPVIDLSSAPWSDGARTIKWLEDKILATVILILITPLLIGIAILVKLTSPGPVFFCQPRHGQHGRPFTIFKFRTMRNDPLPTPKRDKTPPPAPAQDGLESDIFDPVEIGQDTAFRQAQRNDPRVTPIGRFLRNSSLDELPQFLNVIFGQMSIVGPRPHAVDHNRQYIGSIADLMRRHHVKPGITGLAQISGARGQTPNTQSMRNRLRYDLEYIHTWSLWLDCKIIALTVLKGFINRQP